MKERMVIERPINNINDDDYIHIYHFARKEYLKYKIEKLPETFDELIEICIDTFKYISVGEFSNTNQKYMIIKELTFCENGNILNEKGYNIVVKRTPQQMWNIIKSLIGEE